MSLSGLIPFVIVTCLWAAWTRDVTRECSFQWIQERGCQQSDELYCTRTTEGSIRRQKCFRKAPPLQRIRRRSPAKGVCFTGQKESQMRTLLKRWSHLRPEPETCTTPGVQKSNHKSTRNAGLNLSWEANSTPSMGLCSHM